VSEGLCEFTTRMTTALTTKQHECVLVQGGVVKKLKSIRDECRQWSCESATDAEFEYIANNFADTEAVDVVWNMRVTDVGVVALARTCSNLRELCLRGCSQVTDKGVEALALSCPNLEVLNLTWCDLVSDASIVPVAMQCRNLKEVRLCTTAITNESVKYLGIESRKLEYLDLRNCAGVDDDGMGHLGAHCHNLKVIELGYTKVSDDGVAALAKGSRHLEVVSLTECINVGDAGIVALASACTKMKDVELCGTNVTDVAVAALADSCSELNDVNLSNCANITDDAVIALARGRCRQDLVNVDVSFTKVTTLGLKVLVDNCKKVEHLNVVGCEVNETELRA